ncbi:hypothetical protein KIK06_18800 [Nocardiopsis sp. EMB25]|uniref:hypothetical protein n=1 Tax=Nocardiopsis sp. EMB25 TaxID=2835867 RepID=UPI0022843A83|nr:hypothetical protein [Nocardiopsis sp. EMB25]MCY9785942.1 hypothetical protein [Nocardiopsis sp. EMB25]
MNDRVSLPAAALRPNDIVVMPDGSIRAVTAVHPHDSGAVSVRLGVTWYRYERGEDLNVADRGPAAPRPRR